MFSFTLTSKTVLLYHRSTGLSMLNRPFTAFAALLLRIPETDRNKRSRRHHMDGVLRNCPYTFPENLVFTAFPDGDSGLRRSRSGRFFVSV